MHFRLHAAVLWKIALHTGIEFVIVAFDTWTLSNQNRNTGIHCYSLALLNEFKKLLQANDHVCLRVFSCDGYSDDLSELKPGPGFEIIPASALPFHRTWKLAGLGFAAYRADADLIFSPSFYVCPWGRIPVVATIHDVTPVTSPALRGWRNRVDRTFLWNCAKLSQRCIADSECTKNDLVNIYDLPPEKITVIYLGYDKERFNTLRADQKQQKLVFERCGIRSPYILHHGTIQPRKNLERLIQAFRLLSERQSSLDLNLVLAGSLGWEYHDVLRMVRDTSSGDRITLAGPVSEDELPLLVKGAALCAIPSLYEGFCLPMIEAMACGVPTVVSNTSCLPEVSGGVLWYFDPASVEDMADALEKALSDSELRAEMIKNGIARAGEFSWERCARETLDVLVRACEQPTGRASVRATTIQAV
jgi:glycosyltransferase involved in cell wall biosynthesis